jgi:urea carboxylase-associated protein 2
MTEYEDTIPGGRHWSMLIRRGVQLKLTDVSGGGNVGMLMFNPLNYLERLNLPDTLKCQHTFKLTTGHCLYSDMGRVFCSSIDEDVGWHDAASGTCNAHLVANKWGASSYQDDRNDYLRNGRDSFLIELAKYGLGKSDMVANMNWFGRVDVDGAGGMAISDANSKPGDAVILRFEMDTLVIMHTCPHPLDTASAYPRNPIAYQLSLAESVPDDDPCLNSRQENARGFANNQLYLMGV